MEALTLGELLRLAPALTGTGALIFMVWAFLKGLIVPGHTHDKVLARLAALEARNEKMLDVAQGAMFVAKAAAGAPETPVPPPSTGGQR